MDWPVNLTYVSYDLKVLWRFEGNLCAVFEKTKSKFETFHYMETGIQYVEVKQNVEPANLKSHTRKFSEVLHSGFN